MDLIDKYLPLLGTELISYKECISVMHLISSNHGIIKMLDYFIEEKSFGNDIYGFNFPNIYEPCDSDDEDYFENGVQFYFHGKVKVVSNDMFINLIEVFCELYLQENPSNAPKIKHSLNLIKVKFRT